MLRETVGLTITRYAVVAPSSVPPTTYRVELFKRWSTIAHTLTIILHVFLKHLKVPSSERVRPTSNLIGKIPSPNSFLQLLRPRKAVERNHWGRLLSEHFAVGENLKSRESFEWDALRPRCCC